MSDCGENTKKIVEFEKYCEKCKHWTKSADAKPCSICLSIAARDYSHTPEFFDKVTSKK